MARAGPGSARRAGVDDVEDAAVVADEVHAGAPEWWTLADAENHGVDVTTWWGRESTRLEEERPVR